MSVAPPLATIVVGVVVERRKAQSPWVDFIWKPVDVLPGQPAAGPWTLLSETSDAAVFYAGAAEIALYRTETANYRENLGSGTPMIWVALRPTGAETPYQIFGVSADPAEGEAWTQSEGDIVDAVPMPQAVQDVIAAFVTEHHVEQPFVKRKRSPVDPEALARRQPARGERR